MAELLAVPNVSEGRDHGVLTVIGGAFGRGGARVLDVHADPDHNRAVFSLAGEPGRLAEAVAHGVAAALEHIDVRAHAGEHPRVGAVDVAPIVYPSPEQRGAACAEALVLADLLGTDLQLAVFLYGELAGGRTRAEIRRGGPQALAERIATGELTPDAGPAALGAGGATLVGARPPLVAFNVELAAPATLDNARRIAADIREGGAHGLPGVRAIGLHLERQGIVQVSTNVEEPDRASPGDVVRAVRERAAVAAAELVGLAPTGAFADFPADIAVKGYDAETKDIGRLLARK